MAILNGKEVDDNEIDPKKHKFIGMFRKPSPPNLSGGYFTCSCGQVLKYFGEETEHWNKGCFDIAQYTEIGE